jgi:hypothetical protein
VVIDTDAADPHRQTRVAAMRDHCLLRSACRKTIRRAQKLDAEKDWCPYIVIGHLVDDQLPMRMRWFNSYRAPSLLYDYSRLSLRECVFRVDTEWAHLKASRPRSDFVALQFARIIEESLDKIFSVVWKLPAGLGAAKRNTVAPGTAPRANKQ